MLAAVAPHLGGPNTADEQRQVSDSIRASRYRDGLKLQPAQAVRGEDILGLVLDHAPTVIHFSGHATVDGLRVLTSDGGDAPMVTAGLGELLTSVGKAVRLAVLNACDSSAIAEELAQCVGCAIGYQGRVRDGLAQDFARDFYRCIGTGLAVGPAHRAAAAVAKQYGATDAELPRLHARADVDPETTYLLHPAHMPPLPGPGRLPNATAFLARRAAAKPFTVLLTGITDSEDGLRSRLSSAITDVEIQWIQIDHRSNDI